MNTRSDVQPLPVASAPGVEPLAVSAKGDTAPAIQPAERAPVVEASADPVEDWLENGKVEGDSAKPIDADGIGLVKPDPSVDANAVIEEGAAPKAAAEQKKPDDAAAKPVAAVATEEAPAAAAAPSKPAITPDEKITLAEGVEWTRGQVVDALSERRALLEETLPKLEADVKGYVELFGFENAEKAREAWMPALQRLGASPQLAQVVDSVVMADDPGLVEYLSRAIPHYYNEVGAAPSATGAVPAARPAMQPAPAQVPPELAREVESLRAFRQQQESREATTRVQNEINAATAKYPFLASDQGLMSDLIASAHALYNFDASRNVPPERRRGILDALASKASIYDSLLVARSAAQTPQPVAAAAAPQPATLPAQGAAPGGSRPDKTRRPKNFGGDLDAAVDDWAANESSNFA